MALYTTTQSMTALFTPPASCASSWTYEDSYYNSISGGLMIQNALESYPDTECFPSNFNGFGRAPSINLIYSPGACPIGYSTAGNNFNGATTIATCCPIDYRYMVTYSSINYASSSAPFYGCISTFASDTYTNVYGRTDNEDLATTYVTDPVTMWAQPISVAFRQQDLSLFETTSTEPVSSSTRSPSAGSRSLSSAPTSTATPTSSTPIAPSQASAAGEPSASPSSNQGLSSGAIAGIAIGCAAIIGLFIGLALFFRRRKHRSSAGNEGVPYLASDSSPPEKPSSREISEQQTSRAELSGGEAAHELGHRDSRKGWKSWKHGTNPQSPVELEANARL